MIWVFGLITGLAFDMPLWWWVMGLFMGLIANQFSQQMESW